MMRPVTLRDVPGLTPLWPERSQSAVYQLVARILHQVGQGRGYGAVLVDDAGRVFGYGQLTLWSDGAEIADLVVAPDQRRRGWGTQMIHHLIARAEEMRCKRIEIGAANAPALRLYRRLGFRAVRTVKIDGSPVIYLELWLE
jgi:[ribosomal protein S18]-alanine N-acetyltransferase